MALYPSELLYQMSLIVLVPRAGPEKRHPWRRPICRCRARNHSASVHWMSEVRIQGIEENDGPTLSVMIAIFACWVVAYLWHTFQFLQVSTLKPHSNKIWGTVKQKRWVSLTEYSTSLEASATSSTSVSREDNKVSIVSSEKAWYSAVDIELHTHVRRGSSRCLDYSLGQPSHFLRRRICIIPSVQG